MKIEQKTQEPPPFNPVTITLESREEVGILAALFGPTNAGSRVVAYHEQARHYPEQFPPLDEGRLCGASRSLSALYDHLIAALNDK